MAMCQVCGMRFAPEMPRNVYLSRKCPGCEVLACSMDCAEKCCSGLHQHGDLDEEAVAAVVAERDAYRKALEDILRDTKAEPIVTEDDLHHVLGIVFDIVEAALGKEADNG